MQVVSEHVVLRRRGRRLVGLCPFHTEKTPSFTVSEELGLFKCFGCGKGGDIFTFVQLRESVPFVEAMRILADRFGVEWTPTLRSEGGGASRADLAQVNEWACKYFRSTLNDAARGGTTREYLAKRGISADTAARFELGLALDNGTALLEAARRAGWSEALLKAADLVRTSDGGRAYDTFRNRLMFPIRDVTRRVVGFGGRTLGDDRAKYVNTSQNPLFDKGRGLYGIHLARPRMTEVGRCVLVEGYMDCIAAHQAGFGETVATLGTALTEAQVDLVRRYTERLIVLFDSDSAGVAAAERAIRVALPRYVGVRLAKLTSKDPADFLAENGPEAFGAALNEAADALELKWKQTRARFQGDASRRGSRDAVADFLGVVVDACAAGAMDAIQRGQIINQVAHLLHLPAEEVSRLMLQLERRRGRSGVQQQPTGSTPASAEKDTGPSSPWQRVLEVLLNEPGLWLEVGFAVDLAEISEPRLRRLMSVALDGVAKLGTAFSVSDALGRCPEVEDAALLTELARNGARRANYDATLRTALEQIHRAGVARRVAEESRRLAGDPGGESPRADAEEALGVIHEAAREQKHFAPRRIIRESLGEAEARRGPV